MVNFLLRVCGRVTAGGRGLAFHGAFTLVLGALLGNGSAIQAAPETFRFGLDVAEVDGSNFLRGEYDFATRFTSIESVAIEFLMPSGLSGGFCSGGGCSSSSLFIELHSLEYVVDRPENSTRFLAPEGTEMTVISADSPLTLNQPEQLAMSFTYLLPNRLTSTPFQLENWPSFLFSGQGALTFQLRSIFSPSPLNSPDAPTVFRYGKLGGISFASLVIEATPVPEPTGLMLAAILLAIFVLRSQRRQDIIREC